MKTYQETIFREGCVALNQGYMGESTQMQRGEIQRGLAGVVQGPGLALH
jgi:hypothetical protein